jgi:hypothetical protein
VGDRHHDRRAHPRPRPPRRPDRWKELTCSQCRLDKATTSRPSPLTQPCLRNQPSKARGIVHGHAAAAPGLLRRAAKASGREGSVTSG